MLADSDETVQTQATEPVLLVCRSKGTEVIHDDEYTRRLLFKSNCIRAVTVDKFSRHETIANAEFYHNMANFDEVYVTEPLTTKLMNDAIIQNYTITKLELNRLCQN